MHAKSQRLNTIKDLLERSRVSNQAHLQQLLGQEGIRATQATLSRDLRELGVVKGPNGYRLAPTVDQTAPAGMRELERAVKTYLVAAKTAGNLAILRTGPGHASPLALEIDRAKLDEAMGTIAGDDTIFVAAKTGTMATRLITRLMTLAGRKK